MEGGGGSSPLSHQVERSISGHNDVTMILLEALSPSKMIDVDGQSVQDYYEGLNLPYFDSVVHLTSCIEEQRTETSTKVMPF